MLLEFQKCVHILIHRSVYVVSYLHFLIVSSHLTNSNHYCLVSGDLDMFQPELPKIILKVDGRVTIVHHLCTPQKEDYPEGIPECGTDALRFALCAYTAQG